MARGEGGGRLDRDPSEFVPKPQNIAAAMSKDKHASAPPAARNLGDVMAPRVDPQTTGAVGGGQDFEAKVKRNESFLSSPEIQNSLLDFAISIMAPGMTTEERQEQQKLDMVAQQNSIDNSLANRRVAVEEGNLSLQEQELRDKSQKTELALKQQQRRAQLFGAVEGGTPLAAMGTVDLLDLAGELAASGDDDGAKIAIQMADTKRQGESTNDILEYKAARADGSFVGGFNDFQQQKIKASVPPGPTTGIPDVLIKTAVEANEQADMLDQQVSELMQTRDLAAKADTGFTANLTMPIRAALQDLGITVGEDETQVNLQQTLAAAQGALALRMRNPDSGFGLTGSTSDRDLSFLQQTVGSLKNTPQANAAILTGMIAKQRWSAEVAREKAEYIYANKGQAGWGKYIKDKMKDREMFTPDEREYLDRLANPNKPAVGQKEAGVKNSQLPQVPPDSISEEDKTLWPYLDDRAKRHLLNIPDPEEEQ